MWLLFLEAGLALSAIILIVWWNMFSGQEDETQDKD